ncbi:carbonic anhydrase [Drechslerella stenobrocha 248]|uniref:Carbonic anhydrase n=1 Tax=Drechslerella stenobrocha 248 TaxID=1043628 RepID=W7I655_9PEZI|nr:carbonic anhydrase [Drechslerella stenobrocha 248]
MLHPLQHRQQKNGLTNGLTNGNGKSINGNGNGAGSESAPVMEAQTNGASTSPSNRTSGASTPSKRGTKSPFTHEDPIEALLTRNEHWSSHISQKYPELFPSLASTQKPQILWFGCSDSRVPETTILNLLPGEVFVHRNIANCLPPNDLSSLSVLQYAVEVLQVKHIIVCGHYGCGGVAAACSQKKLGLIDVWLKNIRDVRSRHLKELEAIEDPEQRIRRLVELNTKAQVHSVLHNSNVIDAIRERGLKVHGFVYDVANGKIRRLEVPDDHAMGVFDLK